MAEVDLSGIGYFLPILSFLLVWVVCFAVLSKAKFFEKPGWNAFVGFVIATIFVSAVGAREYLLSVTTWIAVLIVSLFFVLMILNFGAEKVKWMHQTVGVIFVVGALVVFLVSAISVFSGTFGQFLPWGNVANGDPDVLRFTDWIYSPRVLGAVLLLGISALVSWSLVKYGK